MPSWPLQANRALAVFSPLLNDKLMRLPEAVDHTMGNVNVLRHLIGSYQPDVVAASIWSQALIWQTDANAIKEQMRRAHCRTEVVRHHSSMELCTHLLPPLPPDAAVPFESRLERVLHTTEQLGTYLSPTLDNMILSARTRISVLFDDEIIPNVERFISVDMSAVNRHTFKFFDRMERAEAKIYMVQALVQTHPQPAATHPLRGVRSLLRPG